MSKSAMEMLASLPREVREAWLLEQAPDIMAGIRSGEWWWVGRPEQFPPVGDWFVWLILSGRGWGKTRTGAEWLISQAFKHPRDAAGNSTEWLVIGETISDTRTFCIDGASGVQAVLQRRGYTSVRNTPGPMQYQYIKAPKPIILLPDGQRIYFEGCDDEDTGRGYNAAGAWLDELAKWRYTQTVWLQGILPSIRANLIGDRPRVVVTTTPKPITLLRDWVKRARMGDTVYRVTIGSTFDNAQNLSLDVLTELRKEYRGTTLGRQELYGELLEEVEGALWNHKLIEDGRVDNPPELTYKVVGMDPAGTGQGDETGLVVVGRGVDDEDYVLADYSAQIVGRDAAIRAWMVFSEHDADLLVYEDNFGKQWLAQVLADAYRELQKEGIFPPGGAIPMKGVHAIHGKKLRAEPVQMRYEQLRVHHVEVFAELEDQMCSWVPGETPDSPDRVDALVHAVLWLRSKERHRATVGTPGGRIGGGPLQPVGAQNLFVTAGNQGAYGM